MNEAHAERMQQEQRKREMAASHARHHAARVEEEARRAALSSTAGTFKADSSVVHDEALARLRAALVNARDALVDLQSLNYPIQAALPVINSLAEKFATTH